MKYFSGFLLLFIAVLVTACQQLPQTSIPAAPTVSPFPSPSPIPTFPSLQLLTNATPTPADFSRFAPITADNAANLKPFLGLAQSRINSLAWSPDGEFIAAATRHGLKLYSSDSLQTKPVNLSPFLAEAYFVTFSPTGTMMVWTETSSSGEYSLWSWNLVNGEKNPVPVPAGDLLGLSFNSGGQLIVETLNGNSIQVWLAESETLLATFNGTGDARWATSSPDGRLIVSGGHADLMAHVWDVDSGEEVGAIGKPDMYPNSVAFSPTGNTLAIGYLGAVQLWEVDAWREIDYRRFSTGRQVSSLVFSPNGNLLAIQSAFERKMLIVDSKLKQITELDNGTPEFSPDGKSLAVTSALGLQLIDTTTWELRDSLPPPLGPVEQMVFRPDRSTLVSIHKDNITAAWDLQTATETSRIVSPGKHFLSPDGKLLAVGAESGEVSVWDVDTGQRLKSYHRDSEWGIHEITFSQDDHLLTISYIDSAMSVAFWEWETDREPKVFALDEGLAAIGALTPDGSKLAVQILENEISTNVGVWDTDTRSLLWTSRRGDAAWISSVAFHPNSKILAVGDRWIGTIDLYDANSGNVVGTLNEPDRLPDYDIAVKDIVFSNNGKLIATIISEGPLLWNVENQTAIKIEAGCISSIESIVFSPDDQFLVLAGDKTVATSAVEGRVCIWATQTGELLASLGDKNLYTSKFATFDPAGTMLALDDNGTIWLWAVSR
ncbi:MAG: WD40 repeat domain-containing protein [Chloroflexi bacterium]|nr:MAG: WD40 repeat domain-containing protein [Chloroflexota bacterium]